MEVLIKFKGTLNQETLKLPRLVVEALIREQLLYKENGQYHKLSFDMGENNPINDYILSIFNPLFIYGEKPVCIKGYKGIISYLYRGKWYDDTSGLTTSQIIYDVLYRFVIINKY